MSILKKPFIELSPGITPKPWLEIIVVNPDNSRTLKLYGLIDTGADECAFPAKYASILGHNLEKGYGKSIITGSGVTTAYSHTVEIIIPEFYHITKTLIDFIPGLKVPLLGVESFLSHFILNINYPQKEFSLRIL